MNKKTNTILYVEDEKAIQEELSEFIESFCEVLYIANDGAEGLELYKKYEPDIVITDIQMPKMNGIEMANRIFDINKDTHIIFTTAFSDTKYLQDAIEIHADGYIIKPIDLDKFESILDKVIRIKRLKKELDYKTKYELKKKAELETILATTLDGIAILDLSSKFLYANNAYERMSGYSLSELKSKKAIDLCAEHQKTEFDEVIKRVIKNGYIEHYEKKSISKSGKVIELNISLALMPESHKILIATKDITKEINAKRKIAEYLEIIDENVITSSTDLKGVITYVSKAFCNISGYSKEELLGKKHNIVKDSNTPKELYIQLWKSIVDNKIWTGEIKNKNKKGLSYWVYAKVYPVFDENGLKTGYTSIRHDITNLKKIEEMAIQDALTGTYNRHFFNQNIIKYIQSAKRNNELVCFAIFDIDFFKQYNDTYGHQEGDRALVSVAKIIKEKLNRADDYLFRLGGEEFGVLFKSNSKKEAIDFTKEFLQVIQALKIEHKNSSVSDYLSISIGLVCEKASLIEDEEKLYKMADDLLYEAKRSGRNKIFYNK